jgi:hypothetical protein
MDNNISKILHFAFTFAYPMAFFGAILFSINSFMTVDLFSIALNKTMILIFNIYIGFCGFIGMCTFFRFQFVINNFVLDFEKIYISYQQYNLPYEVGPGQTEISLSGF